MSVYPEDEAFRKRVLEYLRESMNITVETTVEFGPVHTLKVKLWMDNEMIDSSTCDLPKPEEF